jgi:hypothetical protein
MVVAGAAMEIGELTIGTDVISRLIIAGARARA